MKCPDHCIVGIHVKDRNRHAARIQKILTGAGRHIRTRLGLHDPHASQDNGLILLELAADTKTCTTLLNRLKQVRGVDIHTMRFPHD